MEEPIPKEREGSGSVARAKGEKQLLVESGHPSACDRVLAAFRGDDPGGVIWQPRLEYWYEANRRLGTLPEPLTDASLIDVYDYCGASVRYFTLPLQQRHRRVEVTREWESDRRLRITWRTPQGALTELRQYDVFKLSWHNLEWQVEQPEDFAILEAVLEDEEWVWDQDAYEEDLDRVGERGCPQFFFRRSPIQSLFIDRMGYEPAIHALYEEPGLIRRYVRASVKADDALYEALCQSPVPILNLGENIDAALNPPPIWHEHLAPYYARRIDQLHEAGKIVHIHVDGSMRALLPHLRACAWDGLEAATPQPQGDVSLEEIKQLVGEDRVLLDGIPALYFLPDLYPVEELVDCVRRIVQLFYPRVILGISDELPPDADIGRVRLVGRLVADMVQGPGQGRHFKRTLAKTDANGCP